MDNKKASEVLHVKFLVASSDKHRVHLVPIENDNNNVHCHECTQKSTCQSLSIYHWFFSKQAIDIKQSVEKPINKGEQIALTLSAKRLQRMACLLLGLPLVGFILVVALSVLLGEVVSFFLGLIVAFGLFQCARKYTRGKLTSSIEISNKINKITP